MLRRSSPDPPRRCAPSSASPRQSSAAPVEECARAAHSASAATARMLTTPPRTVDRTPEPSTRWPAADQRPHATHPSIIAPDACPASCSTTYPARRSGWLNAHTTSATCSAKRPHLRWIAGLTMRATASAIVRGSPLEWPGDHALCLPIVGLGRAFPSECRGLEC